MRVAVIPARGGSKRIPRKNIRSFFGKPMIAWSIEAARASQCFDRIIVSTDDEEIARVSTLSGAEVPFKRPDRLSDDYSGTVPVIAHAVDWLRSHGEEPELACCIYATAPFLHAPDLERGVEMLLSSGADYAFSVTNYAFPVQRAIRINSQNRVEMLDPENFHTRSQDLEEVWHDAGQFYWGKARSWLACDPIFSSSAVPVVLPRHRVQDIDTLDDWKRAELMFSALQNLSG